MKKLNNLFNNFIFFYGYTMKDEIARLLRLQPSVIPAAFPDKQFIKAIVRQSKCLIDCVKLGKHKGLLVVENVANRGTIDSRSFRQLLLLPSLFDKFLL